MENSGPSTVGQIPGDESMSYVSYEKRDKIAHIMLNRSKYNPINYEMAAELDRIWQDFQNDDGIWVGIIGSGTENFSSGFDIHDFKMTFDEGKFSWAKSALFGEKKIGPDGHGVTKPIVGAFNGIVNAASMWLFLQSDIRLATPHATFGLSEGKLNIPVEFSGLLTRYLPRAIIHELLFLGSSFTAERFYGLGIINKIVSEDRLMQEAIKTAENICELGPLAVRLMKELVHHGCEMDAEQLMSLSAGKIVSVVNSHDTKRAVDCFFEKTKPEWELK